MRSLATIVLAFSLTCAPATFATKEYPFDSDPIVTLKLDEGFSRAHYYLLASTALAAVYALASLKLARVQNFNRSVFNYILGR